MTPARNDRYNRPTRERMLIPDIPYEAAFLRAALLLGLMRERDVTAWADGLLATTADEFPDLTDVALVRPELTATREALRPLAEPSDSRAIGAALLTFIATDPGATGLPLASRVRVLSHLRSEGILDDAAAWTVKSFEDRWMLVSAGVPGDAAVSNTEVDTWLTSAAGGGYYRFLFPDADERAAFLGSLSRKVVRDRRVVADPAGEGRAWLVESRGGDALLLNGSLWRTAVAEFSPLPPGSRIPYEALPHGAVVILDEATAEPMGAAEAGAHLSMRH